MLTSMRCLIVVMLPEHRLRPDPEDIVAARIHLIAVHPDQMRRELVGDFRPLGRPRQHIAAADIDLVLQRQRHRVFGFRRRPVAVGGDDALDPRGAPGGGDDDLVAGRDTAGRHGSGIAAKVGIGPVHPLHRKPERLAGLFRSNVDPLQIVEQAAGPGTSSVRLERLMMLSPNRAEIGIGTIEAKPRPEAKAA